MTSDGTPLVVKINEKFPAIKREGWIVETIKADATGKTYR
jgi:hypothetical protein